MKKIFLFLTIAFAYALVADGKVFAQDTINLTIDGVPAELEGRPPVIVNGTALVPPGVFELLGFEADWSEDIVTLKNCCFTIVTALGSTTFTLEGASRELNVPAQIVGYNTMLPLCLVENLGFFFRWSNGTQTLEISTRLPERVSTQYVPYIRLRPMVALTFDDGPAAHTEHIVNLLEYHDARATFFVVGRRLEARRDIVFEAGNEIANHTFHHQIMTAMRDDADIIYDIQAGSRAIYALIGESPPIVRPPGGAVNNRVARVAGETGYALVMWSIDTLDWRDRNANVIYQRIMSNVREGDIILLHDTHRTTALAMERVIPRLIEEGFQLVTVSELLHYTYGSPEPGRIYFRARH
ncbi:MAG: polysaccharide deacetylase family protein [Defluviitaleaceae bacterium]|nr:polysaccharide deacetylase family protein [Defluviitaleaceae bacterium]